MSHKNIPLFIPHQGCPNTCVFCNQRTISGHDTFDRNSVYSIIDNALSTIDTENDEVEIAFFGGSFTGIDRDDMIFLLKAANQYIVNGKVSSIRLSTRPDYINSEILEILKFYGVTDIELGVQSMCDRVLYNSKRGHNSITTEESCKLIKEHGFNLVGQMMLGLPSSTREDEILTAEKLIECRVDAVRIYPTVVFPSTELSEMMKSGCYAPLSVDEAADRAACILIMLDKSGIPCIRCGLQSQDNFNSDTVLAGAYHPAFGSIANGRVMRMNIEKELEKFNISPYVQDTSSKYKKADQLTVYSAPNRISDVIGYKKENKSYFYHKYNLKIKAVSSSDLSGYACKIKIN